MAEKPGEELSMEDKINEMLRLLNVIIQANPEARKLQNRSNNAQMGRTNAARVGELEEKVGKLLQGQEEGEEDEY